MVDARTQKVRGGFRHCQNSTQGEKGYINRHNPYNLPVTTLEETHDMSKNYWTNIRMRDSELMRNLEGGHQGAILKKKFCP